RRRAVGDTVHIRAILEFSNHCSRRCGYCGLSAYNRTLARYRMTPSDIIETGKRAADAGYKTLVLQSGEDGFFDAEKLGNIVSALARAGLAITLSVGELSDEAYAHLKDCGAARYLLKHETAAPEIYKALHPGNTLDSRIRCLRSIKRLGYECGSGFMIGLPGQTLETIADDILLLAKLRCDMAGIGPFIPHPSTPLRDVPHGSCELCRRAVALTRIVMPKINLPATTSLGVLSSDERRLVFGGGANVIMQKVTPEPYKSLYEIYPSNSGETDIIRERRELEAFIRSLDRQPL
ncbi:MAG: [FeFe] hydrogenase H-cluster radical SAM maturase HydE, partial [Clostridia bacterium]